jgi:hypothetical protein
VVCVRSGENTSSTCELKAVSCVSKDVHCPGTTCGGERSSESSWSKLSTAGSLSSFDGFGNSWRAKGVGGAGDWAGTSFSVSSAMWNVDLTVLLWTISRKLCSAGVVRCCRSSANRFARGYSLSVYWGIRGDLTHTWRGSAMVLLRVV